MNQYHKAEIINLLRQLSDILGNRNCNDREWPEEWSEEMRCQFIRAHYWHNSKTKGPGDPEWQELQDDLSTVRCPSDFVFPSVLADMLEGEE
jgi:hypothetical protein